MEIKVATEADQESLFTFEKKKQAQFKLSEMELEMKSWDAPWREESLAFYLKTGWCFVAFDQGEVCGYLLAQPQLFMQAATQSLWIEFVSGSSKETEQELADVAYRWARSKHLQRVLWNEKHVEPDLLDQDFSQRKPLLASYSLSTKATES